MVDNGQLSDSHMKKLTHDAFGYVEKTDPEMFLGEFAPLLTPAHKLSILINMYDTIQVDGQIVEAELKVFQRFQAVFGVDTDTMKSLKKFMVIKNDRSLFLNPTHPLNSGDASYDKLLR